ncbi:MAG TPA: VOC family protein [Acidimicrobiales bacterium]|nr:VOC family protein [Acidimicrobiales bacterium]
MIIVAGTLRVDPAGRDRFLQDHFTVTLDARSAEGCIDFHLTADPFEPDVVRVFERWTSAAAVERFRGSDPSSPSAVPVRAADVHQHDVAASRSITGGDDHTDEPVPVDRVAPAELAATAGLRGWRFVLGALRTTYHTGSFPAAAHLVARIAAAAEAAGHHPDVDVRYPDVVTVVLTTHAVGGVTHRDVALARRISALAADDGARPEPRRMRALEVAIDTLDADRIRPFWAAVLGYDDIDGRLIDPLRIDPPVWFQQVDEPRPGRGRFHIDVSVPHDIAEDRVAAAIAAGGTLVSDEHARSWWVLADPDGNEACISTWLDR